MIGGEDVGSTNPRADSLIILLVNKALYKLSARLCIRLNVVVFHTKYCL